MEVEEVCIPEQNRPLILFLPFTRAVGDPAITVDYGLEVECRSTLAQILHG